MHFFRFFQTATLAIRPKTLWASVCPVMIGVAMAVGDGMGDFPTALLTLVGAIAIQIGTNLANDYFDFLKGADTPQRKGPLRVMQAGIATPRAMRWAVILVFSFSALVAAMLIEKGGWPILWIAIASICSGILYTAGPWALAYKGLGEVFVLVFFGPVAVGGAYYLQTLEINPAVLLSGIAPGLFSVGILCVNNLRDYDEDSQCGKKTLAVRFGRGFAKAEYYFSIVAACLVPVAIFFLTRDYAHSLAATATLLAAYPVLQAVLAGLEGAKLNLVLAHTGELLLIYSLLFSLGWIL